MKKVITLLLAAGLVIGAASAANAVDIKAKGLWHNAMSFADRNFEKHNGSDKMQNATRIRTQIDVIASESLKGVVYFEIGPQNWGKGADGASLGTDGKVVKVEGDPEHPITKGSLCPRCLGKQSKYTINYNHNKNLLLFFHRQSK